MTACLEGQTTGKPMGFLCSFVLNFVSRFGIWVIRLNFMYCLTLLENRCAHVRVK